jgi:predicted ATPase
MMQVSWLLGYPDQALRWTRKTLSLSQEQAHPYSLAFAPRFAAWLHQLRGERLLTQEHAEAIIPLSSEHGFAQLLAQATILHSQALAVQGLGADGIEEIRRGLAALQITGSHQWPYYLALLADMYANRRQVEEGLTLLTEALAVVENTGARFYEAELHRLRGELLLQQINQGLPQETWQRYHELIDKRRAESLTPDEHATLIALSDQIEELNARRVGYLVELARLRQTPLEALMQQLGIQTLPYV